MKEQSSPTITEQVCVICGDTGDLTQPVRSTRDLLCQECNEAFTYCDSCGTWVKRTDFVERECCCVGCLVVD
ncbi:MAG TPA: hypothetical protein PKD55_24560 [Bellilinea sp.]|nr:hypothetical protein [Bellilinea sp.]